MALFDPQAYSITRILTAIKAQIVAVTGLDTSYVRLSATDQYELLANDSQLVVVRVYGLQPWTDAGAGKSHRPLYRTISCRIYSRSSVDYLGDDTNALTISSDSLNIAHLILEEQVLSALDEFFPYAASPNSAGISSLTLEPLHPLPQSEAPNRKPESDVGFITSYQSFQICYMSENRTPPTS